MKEGASQGRARATLWHNGDFVKLWTGRTVSLLGSQVTLLALPFVAISSLQVSPLQVGMLAAIGTLPTLLFGLAAGVWVDRLRRRPVMVVVDLGQALVLLSVPIGAMLGLLSIEYLYVVAFLVGSFSLVFDIASSAFLATLVGRERLVEAVGKLSLSTSAAEIAGPGLAGGLVQALTAPLAIVVDAISFLVSALFVSAIRVPEPSPGPGSGEHRFLREAWDGIRVIVASPLLRPLVGAAAWLTFWSYVLEAISLLYLTRELGLSPGFVGLILAVSNIGFLVGALGAPRFSARLGIGKSLAIVLIVAGVADLATPVLGGTRLPREAPIVMAGLLAAAQFFFGAAIVIFNVLSAGLRQASTTDQLRGRMTATTRVLVLGMAPLGSVMGGVLGEAIGLQATLFVAAGGELLAAIYLVASPILRLQDMPDPVAEK